MENNVKLVSVNYHAKQLADAALLLYWRPNDAHHKANYEQAVKDLQNAITDARPLVPGEDFDV